MRATMRSTERAIGFEPLEPVAAKGKQEPIPVWSAVEARSRFGVDTELRAQTLFVGRDSELALLGETFSRALREPSAQLVTVVGRAGRREEPPRLGVPRGDRPAARSRALAPGALPALRRRHHVLGAGRDREGRGRRARDRLTARGSREAAATSPTSSPTRPIVRGSSIDLRRSSVRRTRCPESGATKPSPPGSATSKHLPLTAQPSS